MIERSWGPLAASPFSQHVGPIEVSWEPTPVFRTVVGAPCANTRGFAHGGYLAGVVDITVGQGTRSLLTRAGEQRNVLTRTMRVDYLRPVALGAALVVSVSLLAVEGAEVAASCAITVDEREVLRAEVAFALR